MARRLTAARARVASERRAAYLAAARELAAVHRAGGGRFWLFERPDRPGEFLEFAERTADQAIPVVPTALATRLAALADYDAMRHVEWQDVPLDHVTGA